MKCPHCGNDLNRKQGYVNRAKKLGVPIYCSKKCSGLARRIERTDEEKKKIKSDYDKARRDGPLKYRILEEKRQYAKTPTGRAVQKRQREKEYRKKYQAEFIKKPEYVKWKHDYDQQYHAKNKYGEFWEAALVLRKIEEIVLPEKEQIRIQNGISNKSQKRKRLWNSRPKI